jgi:MoaA/NifB/PqqE/SkfB family radical SAM enzyme
VSCITPPLPDELYVEVTNRCDSRCQTCVRTFALFEPLRDLTLGEFRTLVDQLPSLRRVVLHGVGEPLLNPDLETMIEHLKQRANPPHVLFNSNALALTSHRQEALIASGLDEFRVSTDAAHPELYVRIRGVDAFERMVANVAAFVRCIARVGHGPRVSLWFTALHTNLTDLPDLVRLAHRLGVNEVYIQRLVFHGHGLARREQSLFRSLKAAEEALLKQAEGLAAAWCIRFRASGSTSPHASLASSDGNRRPWSQCRRPETLMYITANGNVLPCCISPFSTRDYAGLVLGNAFGTRLADIWNGPAYRTFRAALNSDTPCESCQGCGVSWSL